MPAIQEFLKLSPYRIDPESTDDRCIIIFKFEPINILFQIFVVYLFIIDLIIHHVS